MHILYDGTPLLMRSAGVKNYHHSLLKNLIPEIHPHRLSLFPFLRTLAPNRNDRSNYPRLGTSWRLGAVLSSNYLRFPLAHFNSTGADLFHATQHVWKLPRGKCLTSMVHDATPLFMPDATRNRTPGIFRLSSAILFTGCIVSWCHPTLSRPT